jgi:hypothetical protein
MDSEREQFLYRHNFFITLAASFDDVGNECNFHYWHHHFQRATLVFSTTLRLNSLQHILTFRNIGRCSVLLTQSLVQEEQGSTTSLAVFANMKSEIDINIDERIIQ